SPGEHEAFEVTMSSIPARASRPSGPRRSRRHQPPLRLTRRGRWAVFVLAVALLLGALIALGPSVVATGQSGEPVPTRTVTVQPGQTMWDIARHADPSGDIRQRVHEIATLNSLPSAGELEVGQEIAVPVD